VKKYVHEIAPGMVETPDDSTSQSYDISCWPMERSMHIESTAPLVIQSESAQQTDTTPTTSFATKHRPEEPRLVVLVPCLNEEQTIAKVVRDFKAELPLAEIIVFDNDSNDGTMKVARAAGATVVTEK